MSTSDKLKAMPKPELVQKVTRQEAKAKAEREAQAADEEAMTQSIARTGTNIGYSLLTGVLFTVAPAAEKIGGLPVGLDEITALGGAGLSMAFSDGIAGGIASGLAQSGTAHASRKLGRALGDALFS